MVGVKALRSLPVRYAKYRNKKMTIGLGTGVLLSVIGLAGLLFNKRLITYIARSQETGSGYTYTKWEYKVSRVIGYLVSTAFIVKGLMIVLRTIRTLE